jgi:hypothetical protein
VKDFHLQWTAFAGLFLSKVPTRKEVAEEENKCTVDVVIKQLSMS